jgi:hypothetical protein
MARGGGRRTYVRDSAGRFASTPGGGLGAARKAARSQSGRTSTLAARSSLKRSRAKLAAKDRADETLQGTLGRRAQKGAVTRGNRKLSGAKVAARAKLQGLSRAGVIGKPRKPASGSQMLQKVTKPARIPTATSKGVNVRGSAKPRMTATATPRAKGSRTRLPGMGGTIAKPQGLKPGDLSENRANKAYAAVKKAESGEARAKANTARLRGLLSDAIYNLENGSAKPTKRETNKARKQKQSIVDRLQRRLDRQYFAQVLYESRIKKGFADYTAARSVSKPKPQKLAEQPRERRISRLEANRTKANLEWSNADRTIKPKIDKLQAKIREREATGKRATEAQANNLRELVNQYNKSVRSRQVADAAKSYYDSPWTYKPKRMSGGRIDQSLRSTKSKP